MIEACVIFGVTKSLFIPTPQSIKLTPQHLLKSPCEHLQGEDKTPEDGHLVIKTLKHLK